MCHEKQKAMAKSPAVRKGLEEACKKKYANSGNAKAKASCSVKNVRFVKRGLRRPGQRRRRHSVWCQERVSAWCLVAKNKL